MRWGGEEERKEEELCKELYRKTYLLVSLKAVRAVESKSSGKKKKKPRGLINLILRKQNFWLT